MTPETHADRNYGERESGGGTVAFLGFLWRHRRIMVGIPAAVILATLVYVLVVPPRYKAEAVFLPQEDDGPGLLSVAASMTGLDLPLTGLAGLADSELTIQEAILRSERIGDLIDEEFDLAGRYGTSTRERRLKKWRSRLDTGTTKQGLLRAGFEDRDPEFALRVVNRLVDHLDRFNRELRTTRSRRAREFVEGRLEETRARLQVVEDDLVRYQAEHQSLALSPTSEAVVIAGADLLSKRIVLETELTALLATFSSDVPAVRQKKAEIDALDTELRRLPEMGSALARLLREVGVLVQTFAFLSAQLEEQRIEEARDTTTLDLLDTPKLPEKKSWPPRARALVMAAAFGVLFALGAGVVVDAVQRLQTRLAGMKSV